MSDNEKISKEEFTDEIEYDKIKKDQIEEFFIKEKKDDKKESYIMRIYIYNSNVIFDLSTHPDYIFRYEDEINNLKKIFGIEESSNINDFFKNIKIYKDKIKIKKENKKDKYLLIIGNEKDKEMVKINKRNCDSSDESVREKIRSELNLMKDFYSEKINSLYSINTKIIEDNEGLKKNLLKEDESRQKLEEERASIENTLNEIIRQLEEYKNS